MIFHHPLPLDKNVKSASGIRPLKTRKETEGLEYEVGDLKESTNEYSKAILILYPKNFKNGQPAVQRINSFKGFYEKNNCIVYTKEVPETVKEKIELINLIYQKKVKNIFISMPPFKNWFVFFLPFVNIILDIRDGWSIAMKSGYGGIVKPNKPKAVIAALVEKFAINRAILTITCTNGLKNYLERLASKQVFLIMNGYSQYDFEIVQRLKKQVKKNNTLSVHTAVCAGQFSEYGQEKIKMILSKINKHNKKTLIKLIGSSRENNEWILKWVKENNLFNIELEILPRMDREEMYKNILEADYGVAVIRDPDYDFGTKVFDYILCDIPIFDYFDEPNKFTDYFKPFLTSFSEKTFTKSFLRESIINEKKDDLLGCMK